MGHRLRNGFPSILPRLNPLKFKKSDNPNNIPGKATQVIVLNP